MMWDIKYQVGDSVKLDATGLKESSALGLLEGLMLSRSARRGCKITVVPSEIQPKKK